MFQCFFLSQLLISVIQKVTQTKPIFIPQKVWFGTFCNIFLQGAAPYAKHSMFLLNSRLNKVIVEKVTARSADVFPYLTNEMEKKNGWKGFEINEATCRFPKSLH